MVEIYVPPFLGYRHLSEEMGIPKDAVYVITFELLKVSKKAERLIIPTADFSSTHDKNCEGVVNRRSAYTDDF